MKKLLLAFSALISAQCFSADSAVTSLTGKDFQVLVTGAPRVYITGVTIDAGCTHQTPVLLLGEDAHPGSNALYSTLLMAKASGKEVVLQSSECWSNYSTPVLTSMYLKD